ncbi:MAG: radical SAM protein [bacterium]
MIRRQPSPLGCGFFITTKCNFKCNFCNLWKLESDDEMSELETKRIINELGRMDLIYLAIGGGEPLLVPHLFDSLAHAKKSGILFTHLVSNGFLMDQNRAKELKKALLSEISFSLDGDEVFHDQNRGIKNSFKKVMEAVENVKIHSPETSIVLNTILDPTSPENALNAVKIAEKLNVKIKVQPFNQQLLFDTEPDREKSRQLFQAEEIKYLLSAIDEIQKSDYVCNSRAFLENYKAFLLTPEKMIFSGSDCLYGFHHLEIFQNQLFPCLEGLQGKNGTKLSKVSIKKLIRSPEYRKKVESLKKCTECKNNYYICYYEPRLNFPLWNFIKSRIFRYASSNKKYC